jgi:hypothetical protein
MKHASCGLQNHDGSHPQQDSLAACLGSNITSPSSWTTWSSARTCPLRVVVAQGVEWGVLSDEITAVLEVAHPLVESPALQTVADAGELFILSFDFHDDGASVGFELGLSLMVAVVAFNFDGGSKVQHVDCCSQGKEGGSIGL